MFMLLSRYWWVLVTRGVLAILFGVMALALPELTLAALVLVFGAFALADGTFAIVTYALIWGVMFVLGGFDVRRAKTHALAA